MQVTLLPILSILFDHHQKSGETPKYGSPSEVDESSIVVLEKTHILSVRHKMVIYDNGGHFRN